MEAMIGRSICWLGECIRAAANHHLLPLAVGMIGGLSRQDQL